MFRQYEKALADFTKAIDLNPKLAEAWYNRGRAHSDLGQLDKAITDFSRAIELAPMLVEAWHNRAAAYLNLHQLDKAVVDYAEALRLDAKNVEVLNSLAWLLAKPGVTSPLVGSGKIAHLEDAVGALPVTLNDEEMALLEANYIPHACSFYREVPGADQDR